MKYRYKYYYIISLALLILTFILAQIASYVLGDTKNFPKLLVNIMLLIASNSFFAATMYLTELITNKFKKREQKNNTDDTSRDIKSK